MVKLMKSSSFRPGPKLWILLILWAAVLVGVVWFTLSRPGKETETAVSGTQPQTVEYSLYISA